MYPRPSGSEYFKCSFSLLVSGLLSVAFVYAVLDWLSPINKYSARPGKKILHVWTVKCITISLHIIVFQGKHCHHRATNTNLKTSLKMILIHIWKECSHDWLAYILVLISSWMPRTHANQYQIDMEQYVRHTIFHFLINVLPASMTWFIWGSGKFISKNLDSQYDCIFDVSFILDHVQFGIGSCAVCVTFRPIKTTPFWL